LQWQNYKENNTALPGIGEGHLFVSSSDVADSPRVVTWSYVASSLISIEQQDAGRLFHNNGPTTAKLQWPIMIRALGTCSKPIYVVYSKLYFNNKNLCLLQTMK